MLKKLFSANPIALDLGLLVLRFSTGFIMLYGHGLDKLNSFGEKASDFPDPIGLGSEVSLGLTVFAEVICAMLIVVGLGTRLALIPFIITMLVAVFYIHLGDPFSKMESGMLFLWPAITLVCTGPGKFSLDWMLFRR